MKPSDFQKTIQCQFECKLKKVTEGIVRNYQKELKRRTNKEIPFCELPELVMELKGRIREALIKMILGFDIALEIEEE